METILGHESQNEDLDSLTEEFAVWIESHGLPERSADELLIEKETRLSEAQRLYLTEFCNRWDAAAN